VRLQFVAVCCSVLQCVAVSIEDNARLEMELPREMGQCVVAACCSVYRVAETRRMPQVAGRFSQKSYDL